jgi:hypothetical protein
MNCADLLAAFDVPLSARIEHRVPKKLLVENGAHTAADKRKVNDGIEELSWVAALKPTTIGVSEFRDATREYLEIAILHMVLRKSAACDRLATLVHRAVPYPVLLIATQGDALTISLGHKRHSQAEAIATVLDGALVVATRVASRDPAVLAAYLREMAVTRQPRRDLFALYQGWIDTTVSLLAAQVTGTFTASSSPEMAATRRTALLEYETLEEQISRLRAAAGKERQLARQVELNSRLTRMQAQRTLARSKL